MSFREAPSKIQQKGNNTEVQDEATGWSPLVFLCPGMWEDSPRDKRKAEQDEPNRPVHSKGFNHIIPIEVTEFSEDDCRTRSEKEKRRNQQVPFPWGVHVHHQQTQSGDKEDGWKHPIRPEFYHVEIAQQFIHSEQEKERSPEHTARFLLCKSIDGSRNAEQRNQRPHNWLPTKLNHIQPIQKHRSANKY